MPSRNTVLWHAVCKVMSDETEGHCTPEEITFGASLQMFYDALDKLCEEGNVSGRCVTDLAKIVRGAYLCGKMREKLENTLRKDRET